MSGQSNTLKIIEKDSLSDVAVTCLIFAEHQKLSIENPLLKEQNAALCELVDLYEQSNNLNNQQINYLTEQVNEDAVTIKKLKSSQKRTVVGSTVGGILLFIIGLIL